MRSNFNCPNCSTSFILIENKGFTASLPESRFGISWCSMRLNRLLDIFGICPGCSIKLNVLLGEDGKTTISERE